ncbi:hypothetical protein [Variovorax sp. JS1663]|uniref:hypothetical protein n=1 Tax=Variovorax sp. JS1663 TaxID=1851577 RepID=UPI000B348F11|nr:hypothetical protein [Variovorax sp. JS1663]OUM01749.1 hypothetical protein A8M77_14400 [Variovorax sp. JS1663]
MKLEQDPRITQGPGFFPAVIDWGRRVALSFNPLVDAIGPIRAGAKSISETLDGPAFKAFLGSNSTGAPQNVVTVLTALSEEFDTNGCFETTGPNAGRFTPNVAGYYLVTGRIYLQGVGGNLVNAQGHINKNGAQAALLGLDASGAFAEPFWQRSGAALIPMNGTTDYLTFSYYASVSAGTVTIAGDADGAVTSWTAHLARRL